jgi:hypothetical protein
MASEYTQKYPYSRYKDSRKRNRWLKKLDLIERKGGKCQHCGYRGHPAALDFHHLDPAAKELHIGRALTLSWERLVKEVEECILLCSNCHRIEHSAFCIDELESIPERKSYERRDGSELKTSEKERERKRRWREKQAHRVLHVYGSLEEYEKAGGRGQTYTKKKRGLYWVAYCPSLSHAHVLAGATFSEIYFHGVEREIEEYLLALKRTPYPPVSTNKKAAISDDPF